jgi:hypothetical protein
MITNLATGRLDWYGKNQITAFYAENFKAIDKGTWFELNKLNVLTGPNNSGKSTLFQAMKIFTEGFADGDFPKIEIQKVLPDCGYFDDLLNFNTDFGFFKLGFRYYSKKFSDTFDVIYTFVRSEDNKYAVFHQVEVFKGDQHLMSFVKYPFQDIKTSATQDYALHFISILFYDNPGELYFIIKIETLSSLLGVDESTEHIDVFSHLKKNFGEYWSGELLEEDKFTDRIPFLRFSDDVLYDLDQDYYCNLYKFDLKYPIFNDDDSGESFSVYKNLRKNLGYSDFIRTYFYDLFDEISSQLRFFYNKNLFHIEFSDSFHSRILFTDEIGFRIPLSKFIEPDDLPNFDEKEISGPIPWKAYRIFYGLEEKICNWFSKLGMNGAIITEEIENNIFKIFYHDYDLNRSTNIAVLGKGHARLIQLMLSIVHKLVVLADDDRGKKKSDKDQAQIIFHIEEPEAYLHPSWQSKLADLFAFIAEEHSVQFLIETHSVYFIQKLQLLVARKEIEPTDISLLYFEKIKNDVTYRKINIRKDGLLKESFGEGFYDESGNLAIELLDIDNLN